MDELNKNDNVLLGGRKTGIQPLNKLPVTRTIYPAIVINNDDPYNGNRIAARIGVLDRELDDTSDLLYAFPLDHKSKTFLPKVGEAVGIILSDVSKPHSLRFWFGPINSQFQNLLNDQYATALSLTDEAITGPDKPISSLQNADLLYPIDDDDKTNLTHLGRDNTDVKHRRNELTLRAGRHLTDQPLTLNQNNPCFTRYRITEDNKVSSIVSVANYHVLIAKQGENISNTTSFSDEDLQNVIQKGNSMVRGEPMIDFLTKLRDYVILYHSHRNNNISPNKEEEKAKELLNFDFNTIISQYHKIN